MICTLQLNTKRGHASKLICLRSLIVIQADIYLMMCTSQLNVKREHASKAV